MTLPTLTFIYNRKHQASTAKTASVELRITYDRRQKYVASGLRLLPREWRRGRVVNRLDAVEANRTLDIMMEDVRKVVNDMMQEGALSLDEIPEKYRRLQKGAITFLEYVAQRITVRKYGSTKDTQARYDRFYRYFSNWGKVKFFSDVTDKNVLLLDEALKAKGLKNYSKWNNYHRFFNSFIIDAVDEGYLKRNPYKWLHIEKDKGDHGLEKYLTKEEFKRIETVELSLESLERARDVFVFQTYTCLSYTDLRDFDYSRVKAIGDREIYSGHRHKTGQEYAFLLRQAAVDILEKYNSHLPVVSNETYNRHLKVIALLAGINKPVSSHWARHTGATLLLNAGLDMELVAKVLGHSNPRITRSTYAKLLEETVAEGMAGLE